MPAKMMEGVDGFKGASRIFMVRFVESEGVSGGLIVNTDEDRGTWSCGNKNCGDSFLYCMEFGIVHFGPIAEMAVSVLQQVELLVPVVEYGPSTADSAIFQFGAVGAYDDGMGGEST